MKKVEKLMWFYLMKNGECLRAGEKAEWDYYSGFHGLRGAKKDVLPSILRTGIDWEKTKSVSEDREAGFNGTFADAVYVNVLFGTLVTLDGKEYSWFMSSEDGINILSVVEFLIDNHKVEGAFDSLLD